MYLGHSSSAEKCEALASFSLRTSRVKQTIWEEERGGIRRGMIVVSHKEMLQCCASVHATYPAPLVTCGTCHLAADELVATVRTIAPSSHRPTLSSIKSSTPLQPARDPIPNPNLISRSAASASYSSQPRLERREKKSFNPKHLSVLTTMGTLDNSSLFQIRLWYSTDTR